MHRADKAVLRLGVGLGLAVLIAYGLALQLPFVVCVVAVLLLCKPGPPIPFVKGAVFAARHRRIAGGGRADGPGPGALPCHRAPPDRRIALRSVFRRRAQRQSVDDLPGDRPHVHSRGRCRRAGAGHGARPGLRAGAGHRRSGQRLLARLVPRSARPRPHPGAARWQSVRKRQAGARCRRRWSSCRYSCWR